MPADPTNQPTPTDQDENSTAARSDERTEPLSAESSDQPAEGELPRVTVALTNTDGQAFMYSGPVSTGWVRTIRALIKEFEEGSSPGTGGDREREGA